MFPLCNVQVSVVLVQSDYLVVAAGLRMRARVAVERVLCSERCTMCQYTVNIFIFAPLCISKYAHQVLTTSCM